MILIIFFIFVTYAIVPIGVWCHASSILSYIIALFASRYNTLTRLKKQKQFSLTWERICCPKPRAGCRLQIRSWVKENYCCQRTVLIFILLFFKTGLFTLSTHIQVFNIFVRHVREYRRRLDIVTSISHDLLSQWKRQ